MRATKRIGSASARPPRSPVITDRPAKTTTTRAASNRRSCRPRIAKRLRFDMRPLFRRVTDRYFSRVISVAALQLTWRLLAGGIAIVTALLISVALGLATQGVVATSNSFLAGLSVLTGSGFAHAASFVASRRPESVGRTAERSALLAIVIGALTGVLAATVGPRILPTLPVLWWQVAIALPFAQAGQLGLGLQQGLGSSRGYVAIYVAPPLGG